MQINKESLTKLSNNYLKVLSDLSNFKEIAIQNEKKLEEKAKVLEKTVDTNNIDTNRS